MRLAAAALLVALAVLATFFEVREFEFVNRDDDINVYENPHLHPITADTFAQVWTAPYVGLYIPVSYSVWAALAWGSREDSAAGSVSPLDPGVFHTANLALHALASVLVLFLLFRITGRLPASTVGAFLFALHPLQVETVAWVTELRGLLSACLSLLAMGAYVSYCADPVHRRRTWLAGLGCFALALLSKPSAVAVPLMLLALDGFALRRDWRAALRSTSAWFGLAALAALGARTLQTADTIEFVAPLWARPMIAGDAFAHYLQKLVWPTELAMDYGRTPEVAMESAGFFFLWLLPLALMLVVFAARRARSARAPLALFTAGLLPVLGLIPFSYQDISTVADRYVYLAMLGPALGVAALVGHLRGRGVWLAAIVVLSLLGWKSRAQTRTWRTTETVASHAIGVSPGSWGLHVNLGSYYSAEGRLEEARASYREALRLHPEAVQALFNLAAIASRSGQLDEARGFLERAVEIEPGFAEAHASLGLTAMQMGDIERAEQALEAAENLAVDRAEVHQSLGVLCARLKDLDRAHEHLTEAVRLRPGYIEARFNLAYTAEQMGRKEEARKQYERILELRADFEAARAGLQRLE